MLNYVYYRVYSFYKKNGFDVEPHIWATVIPTFIVAFLLNAIYYLGVRNGILPWSQGSLVFYAIVLLVLAFIMDRAFENKIYFYSKRWDKENGGIKTLKGIVIAIIAVGCFVGVFVIANELRKLKP